MALVKLVEQKKGMMKCVCVVKKITLSVMYKKDLKRNCVVLGSPLGGYRSLVGSGMRIKATISNLQEREGVVLNLRDFK